MTEFFSLRAKARERRDREIAAVKEEYQRNLAQIAELEQRLLGRADPKRIRLSAAIERCIPRDEPFTITSILHALEAMDPSRVWRLASVGRHVRALRERGLVRRLKRATTQEAAQYVRSDGPAKVEPVPKDRTMRDYIAEVLTRPMTTAEVVMGVVAAGFKTTMRAGNLRDYVKRELRAAGFGETGGRWS
jgi:hypothetical protein